MTDPSLSKSTFLRGVQCAKALYLHQYHPRRRDPVGLSQQARFRRGTRVGVLARDLFPGGADASAAGGTHGAGRRGKHLACTQQLLEAGAEVIYEAAFLHENVLAVLDILVRRKDGWYAYEVKSSRRLTPTYELDAALQHYVITGSGLPLRDIAVVYLNEHYRRGDALDLTQLFQVQSVGHLADHNRPFVARKVAELRGVLTRDTLPQVDIGPQCHRPYRCDFVGHCWRHLPRPSVFDVAELSDDKKFGLYYTGTQALTDVPDTVLDDYRQRIQVNAARAGQPEVAHEALYRWLEPLGYPLLCWHAEAAFPAVPPYPGTRPYGALPLLSAVRRYAEELRPPAAAVWMALPDGPDPRPAFLADWLRATAAPGPILTFGADRWRQHLIGWAEAFPGYAEGVAERLGRLHDLATPFERYLYYHPGFQGRTDCETVLKTLLNRSAPSRDAALKQYDGWTPGPDLFGRDETAEALADYLRATVAAHHNLFAHLRERFRVV